MDSNLGYDASKQFEEEAKAAYECEAQALQLPRLPTQQKACGLLFHVYHDWGEFYPTLRNFILAADRRQVM